MNKSDPTQIFNLLYTPYKSLLDSIRKSKNLVIPQDIHDAHLIILFAIDREFGSNQKKLADKLFISKQSIGVSIDYLIGKKYLNKIKDPVDARANLIKLSDKGWSIIEACRMELKEIMESLKEKIGLKNYKKLFTLLKLFNSAFD
ncbi:MAG: MarR family winged helix-turn-helix transcriptional regulator [Saprospiraceae bacterium]